MLRDFFHCYPLVCLSNPPRIRLSQWFFLSKTHRDIGHIFRAFRYSFTLMLCGCYGDGYMSLKAPHFPSLTVVTLRGSTVYENPKASMTPFLIPRICGPFRYYSVFQLFLITLILYLQSSIYNCGASNVSHPNHC